MLRFSLFSAIGLKFSALSVIMLVALDKFGSVVIPPLMLTMSGVLSTACLSVSLSLKAVTIHLGYCLAKVGEIW